MPLYQVKNKQGRVVERVRTVAGSPEDERLAGQANAKLVDESKPDSGEPTGQNGGKNSGKNSGD